MLLFTQHLCSLNAPPLSANSIRGGASNHLHIELSLAKIRSLKQTKTIKQTKQNKTNKQTNTSSCFWQRSDRSRAVDFGSFLSTLPRLQSTQMHLLIRLLILFQMGVKTMQTFKPLNFGHMGLGLGVPGRVV